MLCFGTVGYQDPGRFPTIPALWSCQHRPGPDSLAVLPAGQGRGLRTLTAGPHCRAESQHRFWKPSEVDEEVDSAEVSEVLRSRHITFAGRFEPVQHRCRAPRPDGRLCERQDRLKVRLQPWGEGC